jgi:23S rRNA (uracil747-C5)-methyltransferase
VPYADQVRAKQQRCAVALSRYVGLDWLPPYVGAESAFRNKAKMVVSGSVAEPVLGILGPDGGVDLQDCGLHERSVAQALPVLASFITDAGLTPYDVATRRGELKYVLVTGAPSGQLMVRFVCRSQEPVARIRKYLGRLTDSLPAVVVSVNVQPEHKAILEGDQEIVLTAVAELVVTVNDVELSLRPQSFFQTNTEVAAALYRTAQAWVAEPVGAQVWDLYCGVGGFALHLARTGHQVIGLEVSESAVASARSTAERLGLSVRFECGDASSFAYAEGSVPDLVVVNPPRRGVGPELAGWLGSSGVSRVLYSSCNPESLAADLAAMSGLVPVRAQVFDMFPQTAHAEVLVLLERVSTGS